MSNVASITVRGPDRKPDSTRPWVWVLALAVAGVLLGVWAGASETTSPETPQPRSLERFAGTLPAEGFRGAAKRALPAVVSILSSKTVRVSPREMDPFWREFFAREFEAPKQYRERGQGSGVIVRSDGYVLTNEHVVHGATDIRIVLSDKREFKAKAVGSDPKTDLAVLRVEAQGLPSLELSDSSRVEPGDIVLAIGNPFGVGESVTMGIVSATARSNIVDPERYEDFIQTDAAINPGNSGGALITAHGELIAINSAIISRSGGYQGIGFAIPANVARHVMTHILKDGRVVRGWLGVSIQPLDAATAKAFRLKAPGGALVGAVTPGSPADKAGIQRGDAIVEFNGAPLADAADLRMKVGMADPGTAAMLKIVRDGGEREVRVTLGEFEERRQRASAQNEESTAVKGLTLRMLTSRAPRAMELPAGTEGAVVEEVAPDTPAADAGLRSGDVIVEVNRKRVTSVEDVRRALASGEPTLLWVNRGGNAFYAVVEGR